VAHVTFLRLLFNVAGRTRYQSCQPHLIVTSVSAAIKPFRLRLSTQNADPAGRHGNDELVSELRAQLSEARSEHERLCGEMTVLTERLNSAQRDLAMRKAAGEGWKEQRASHARLTTELQERNSSLEKELTKVNLVRYSGAWSLFADDRFQSKSCIKALAGR